MKRTRTKDEKFMALALALAKKGKGWVSPNPMVGAVVVDQEGCVLARGYHRRYGGLHAEREALKKLGWRAPGATMYVNLEPCCHYGKTPPCTEAIIQAGIRRVVVGTLDPNPLVSGKGVETLSAAGIQVEVGVLAQECRELNRAFFKWVTSGFPWVTLKWASWNPCCSSIWWSCWLPFSRKCFTSSFDTWIIDSTFPPRTFTRIRSLPSSGGSSPTMISFCPFLLVAAM